MITAPPINDAAAAEQISALTSMSQAQGEADYQAPLTPAGAAEELLARRHARQRMLEFTKYTWDGFGVNWHHRVMCDALDGFARGEIANLMLFAPAQHSKSELVSRRLPAFMFGQNPNLKMVAASYAAELVQGMNRDVQRIMDSQSYRRLFPETTLNTANIRTVAGTWLRNSEIFEIVGYRGSYRCAGVGGGLTGFPCDIGVLDDPYKDFKEATSLTVRKAVWEWYTSVFLRRQHKRSRQVFVLTRWHEEDLAGQLLKMEGESTEGGKWTVIKLQGIADEAFPYDPRATGEALWPDRFSAEQLLQQKALNRMQFEAMTQQNPRPKEGTSFKLAWFENKMVPESPMKSKRVRRWDLAATAEGDADSTVGIKMSQGEDAYFIEHMVKGQWDTPERNEIIKETALVDRSLHGMKITTVWPQDPGSAGKDVVHALNALIPWAATDKDNEGKKGDKETRLEPFRGQCPYNVYFVIGYEAYEIWKQTGERPEWVEEIIQSLIAFPYGHDDIPDAVGGAYNWLARPFEGLPKAGVIEWLHNRVKQQVTATSTVRQDGVREKTAHDYQNEMEADVRSRGVEQLMAAGMTREQAEREYVSDWIRDSMQDNTEVGTLRPQLEVPPPRPVTPAAPAGNGTGVVSSTPPAARAINGRQELSNESPLTVSPPAGSPAGAAPGVPTGIPVPPSRPPSRPPSQPPSNTAGKPAGKPPGIPVP